MKIIKSKLTGILFLYLLLTFISCVTGVTETHSPNFTDRVNVENKIKDLSGAESINFTVAKNKNSNDQLLSTDLLIDITNAAALTKNENQIAKQIALITKSALIDSSNIDAFKVNFIQKGVNGEVAKNGTNTLTFKPDEL